MFFPFSKKLVKRASQLIYGSGSFRELSQKTQVRKSVTESQIENGLTEAIIRMFYISNVFNTTDAPEKSENIVILNSLIANAEY